MRKPCVEHTALVLFGAEMDIKIALRNKKKVTLTNTKINTKHIFYTNIVKL